MLQNFKFLSKTNLMKTIILPLFSIINFSFFITKVQKKAIRKPYESSPKLEYEESYMKNEAKL